MNGFLKIICKVLHSTPHLKKSKTVPHSNVSKFTCTASKTPANFRWLCRTTIELVPEPCVLNSLHFFETVTL